MKTMTEAAAKVTCTVEQILQCRVNDIVRRLRSKVVRCRLVTLVIAGCKRLALLATYTLHAGVTMRHNIWLGLQNVSQQLGQVDKYESEELDEATTLAPFQSLIESSLAWSLSGNSFHSPVVIG
jgi:hypothetical protein